MKIKIKWLRSLLHVAFFLIASLGISSCKPDHENDIIPEITVPNGYANYFIDDLSCGFEGAETKVAFQINTSWSMRFVSEDETLVDWCTITPSSGNAGLHKVIVSISQNDTYEPRLGYIHLISGSNKVAEIAVSQSYESAIFLNNSSDTISYEATHIDVEVRSNVDFQYQIMDEASSWMRELKSTRTMNTCNLAFEIDENMSVNMRKARILFYNTDFTLVDTFFLVQEGDPNGFIEGTPVLWSTDNLIVADGRDELTLTVKIEDIDVTEKAVIYLNDQVYGNSTFTTQTVGNYVFYAEYNGQRTNLISVEAIDPALCAALPEDSQPDKFFDFSRNILVAAGLGTWCGYCPYMIAALELFGENGSNADKAVIVATHSGDEFSNAASEAAVSAMNIKGFPSCVLNLNPEVLIQNNYPDINAEKINSIVGMELKEAARVGIAAATALSVDSTIIGVRAAVKVGKNGSYRINAWLIEDGVNGYQSGAEAVISHMHILRGASCVSPIHGQLLGGKELCSEGEILDFYCKFDTKKFDIADVKKCKVVVLVSTSLNNSSRFVVNNVIECKVGDSVPFVYE